MIIAISGLHGTGKSTIAKLMAERLGILYYSTGQAFRDLAKENDMSLEEYTIFVENHPDIDKNLDNKVVNMAKKGNIIIDLGIVEYNSAYTFSCCSKKNIFYF